MMHEAGRGGARERMFSWWNQEDPVSGREISLRNCQIGILRAAIFKLKICVKE